MAGAMACFALGPPAAWFFLPCFSACLCVSFLSSVTAGCACRAGRGTGGGAGGGRCGAGGGPPLGHGYLTSQRASSIHLPCTRDFAARALSDLTLSQQRVLRDAHGVHELLALFRERVNVEI